MNDNGQLSPKETTELLQRLGHSPVKKLGQNFLVDANIVRKSLELANVQKGDFVVEVGPGLGTLTGALLERGAKVFAVELDKNLFKFLARHFGGEDNFDIINADAVEFPRAALPSDAKKFKVVANLPYAISTPWLDKILSGPLPQRMSLMLQREAALRFAAKRGTGDFSPISICLGEIYEADALRKVSASCFHPRPAVDSVLLSLKLRESPYVFSPRTKELMRKVFLKRRKQLGSIAHSADAGDSQILSRWLDSDGAPARESRPENVPPDEWKILDSLVISEK